jgi:hypothetical protein
MNAIHSKRIGALLAVLVLTTVGCGGSSSSSKTVIAGTIKGTVRNASGSALANVTVTAQGAGTSASVTGSDGKFTLSVPPGSYTVSFTGDNLEPATASSGDVGSGATVTMPDQIMAASALKVTVSLPAALRDGGAAGFDTTVTGITVSAKLDGNDVSPDSVSWVVKDYYGLSAPPDAAAAADPATGSSTSFSIGNFETVRQGANAWMNARYGTTGTAGAFEYIQAPERDQLLSLGTQQSRAMAFMVKATVKSGNHTSTGSAIVYPLTITNGGNTLPLGMSVVANAAQAESYAWTLQFLPMTATDATFADAPAGLLQGASTRNPWLVPTEVGVYKLQNGSDAPLYFRVSTYHGVGKSDTDATGEDGVACASCHSGDYSLSDKFAEWSNSAHGNHFWKDPFAAPMPLVEFGLTGGDGPGYSANCIGCHTVGYSKVPTANNKGFDDIAAADGWTFPTTLGADAWATVTSDPGLNHRASIQCENCHGPLEPTDHSQPEGIPALFALPISPTASLNAGVCLVCHDALTHHDRGSLWAASGHANTELAIADGTIENRPLSVGSSGVSGVAHCGRCHAGEGFLLYLDQQQGRGCTTELSLTDDANATTGRAGYIRFKQSADGACANITSDTAVLADATAYFTSQGLTVANVHSQTCQTCHDPHSTELRLSGDTGVTAASFNVKNAGAGALCMVCHNSRIGAAVYADSTKSSYSAPHAASQGDIFAGRNAYFYGQVTAGAAYDDLPYETAHKFMANTCADCHVKWVPEDVKAQYQVWNTNHTFKTSMQVCSECHAEGIGERIAEGVGEKMTALSTKLGLLFRDKLNAGGTDSMARYVVEDGAIGETKLDDAAIAAGSVRGIALSEFHGQPALIVTLTDGTTFGNNIGSYKLSTAALFSGSAAGGIPAKAFYNYLLIHGGAAEGVHNPAFVNGVLDATLTQIDTVSAL